MCWGFKAYAEFDIPQYFAAKASICQLNSVYFTKNYQNTAA
jgi:hypothetical protein